jgi:hypothetical protein
MSPAQNLVVKKGSINNSTMTIKKEDFVLYMILD